MADDFEAMANFSYSYDDEFDDDFDDDFDSGFEDEFDYEDDEYLDDLDEDSSAEISFEEVFQENDADFAEESYDNVESEDGYSSRSLDSMGADELFDDDFDSAEDE